MDDYVEQVKLAIEATVFHSPTSYSWFGKESARLSPRIRRVMTPKTARNYLLYQLQSQLYSDVYIRGTASSRVWSDDDGVADAVVFAEAVSAANTGNGCWENGWEVLANTPDGVVVRRGGLTLWVRLEDCLIPKGGSREPGTVLKLHLPKELLGISPGYYMALSDEEEKSYETKPLVRLYWNLRAEGAESFVRDATGLLNEARLFFRLKVLNDPRSYTRCDAAVVYLHQDEHLRVAEIMNRVYPQVAHYLKPNTPMFTKAIAPGVGLAEDPGQAESFGQHRCRLLADGMIRAYEQGARSLDERLRIVTDYYAAVGIKLSQPYLNPNSTDVYTFRALR